MDDHIIGFTYKGKVYEWNAPDCLYYWVEADDNWFSEVPEGATDIKTGNKVYM